jgi:hypothetical protein
LSTEVLPVLSELPGLIHHGATATPLYGCRPPRRHDDRVIGAVAAGACA